MHFFFLCESIFQLVSPPPPSSPTIVSTTPQSTSITITWTQPEGDVVDSYEITYSYQGPCPSQPVTGTFIVNDGNIRQYNVSDLQEFSAYSITLIAVNGGGNSSTHHSVTTLASGTLITLN